MTKDAVIYEKKGHIAFVTFNRPEALNAYDDQSHANIEQFSDQKGWLVIASHPITKYAVSKMSYVWEMTDDRRDLFSDCSDRLFKLGEAFIGFNGKS